ncbi:MAG TPA: glucans biosynthesis glucosyltransferase MdoH [Xanthobacteraceae bacterium]|nr:glucans biosynthesis glucosyltransferase MdoH [Xanthobacteraceae bacterium]
MSQLLRSVPQATTNRLHARRVLYTVLVVATMAALLGLAVMALRGGGLDALESALLAMFVITLPWTVVGFWNAMIGFLIMRFAPDPVVAVFPAIARLRSDAPITVSTAILACIRNEDPAHVLRNLSPLVTGLAADKAAAQFHVYILSDTDQAGLIAEEERACRAFADKWHGCVEVTYRRRTNNHAFKAGNIRDFCERWGASHDIAVTLDADSVMPAQAVLRLARLMEAEPKLGIVQALVVGLPTTSAFARIFQFGMRFGMRSYTIGSAWWQGDCGPYWGHNAALRLTPFIEDCEIPELPGGKQVLSHDQIEAVLMRRAGYEVRVLPEEDLGWEENPPTLLEFLRRDLRWLQGNMQYWRFLVMPGLRLVSRCQLAIAILMFMGSPAWVGLLVFGTLLALRGPQAIDPLYGWALLALILFMWFAPKIATVLDVLSRAPLRRAYGGAGRLLASIATETVFFILLSPIQWVSHTIQLVKLAFGRGVGWGAQARHDHAVPVTEALQRLWPHTALGAVSIGLLVASNPSAIPVMLLIAGGPMLSVPLAVVTSSPALGRFMMRIGLCSLPEEIAPPTILRELDVPALAARANA